MTKQIPKIPPPYVDRSCKPAPALPTKMYRNPPPLRRSFLLLLGRVRLDRRRGPEDDCPEKYKKRISM